MIDRGVLGTDILSSLISVVAGYVLGFVIALPVAILMAWYKPVRYIIEPWIQFIRHTLKQHKYNQYNRPAKANRVSSNRA